MPRTAKHPRPPRPDGILVIALPSAQTELINPSTNVSHDWDAMKLPAEHEAGGDKDAVVHCMPDTSSVCGRGLRKMQTGVMVVGGGGLGAPFSKERKGKEIRFLMVKLN